MIGVGLVVVALALCGFAIVMATARSSQITQRQESADKAHYQREYEDRTTAL